MIEVDILFVRPITLWESPYFPLIILPGSGV